MPDGLFELVFILLIVVASIVDAIGRSRKKQRRMEEMEREDEGGVAAPSEEPSYGQAEESGATVASSRTSGPESEVEGERETADRMVPEDFWAVLTGEAPPSELEREGREVSSEGEQEPPARDAGDAESWEWSRPGAERPTQRELPEAPVRRSDPDAPVRRSDPDPPAHPHIPVPVPQDRYGRDSGPSWTSEVDAPRPPSRRAKREQEVRRQEAAGRPRRFPPGHRPARSPRYTELLGSGNVEELRRAIVLKEVLGPPAALRDPLEGHGHTWDPDGGASRS